MHICWGAQAGLYYHYKIPKIPLNKKLSGVYLHAVTVKDEPLTRGFDDIFSIPHSCYTEVRAVDVNRNPRLHIVAESKIAGVGIITSEKAGQVFVTGHSEYDADTLAYEYERDVQKGINPEIPEHYFPDNDPNKEPAVYWRGHATLLFTNWLNYYVYQRTPYDLNDIGKEEPR
jgi:homoserine O-succinyltransferase